MKGLCKVAICFAAVTSVLAVPAEHDRQYPRPLAGRAGDADPDLEILKDSAKAGVWFAEHCAPEMILSRLQARKPTYSGLKEKFMCPAIAMIVPHLLPFENPFEAPVVLMPGPIIADATEHTEDVA